jgi:hypothetical protein
LDGESYIVRIAVRNLLSWWARKTGPDAEPPALSEPASPPANSDRLSQDHSASTWGHLRFFPGRDEKFVRPDDVERLKEYGYFGVMFQEVAREGDYLVLEHQGEVFRVHAVLFKRMPHPDFVPGDQVIASRELAMVSDFCWHYDKDEYYYFVTIRGKKKSKRYFLADLVRAENSQAAPPPGAGEIH